MGNPAPPSADACARPSVTNAFEQTVTASRPRFTACTLSWTLHDVHDPQSPDPVMMRSQSRTTSASVSSGAGTEAERLRRLITFATP